MYQARDRQIEACAYVDTLFAKLFEVVPSGTYVVVTADHGDLFGEDGMFGHGSVVHQKVLEVPFVEGVVP
jgi:arylsulfatase A-like enzyme